MLLGCGLDCRTSVPNLQGNGQSLLPEERYQGLTQIRMFPQEFLAAGNAAGSHHARLAHPFLATEGGPQLSGMPARLPADSVGQRRFGRIQRP